VILVQDPRRVISYADGAAEPSALRAYADELAVTAGRAADLATAARPGRVARSGQRGLFAEALTEHLRGHRSAADDLAGDLRAYSRAIEELAADLTDRRRALTAVRDHASAHGLDLDEAARLVRAPEPTDPVRTAAWQRCLAMADDAQARWDRALADLGAAVARWTGDPAPSYAPDTTRSQEPGPDRRQPTPGAVEHAGWATTVDAGTEAGARAGRWDRGGEWLGSRPLGPETVSIAESLGDRWPGGGQEVPLRPRLGWDGQPVEDLIDTGPDPSEGDQPGPSWFGPDSSDPGAPNPHASQPSARAPQDTSGRPPIQTASTSGTPGR
jgi:hypothetical protein